MIFLLMDAKYLLKKIAPVSGKTGAHWRKKNCCKTLFYDCVLSLLFCRAKTINRAWNSMLNWSGSARPRTSATHLSTSPIKNQPLQAVFDIGRSFPCCWSANVSVRPNPVTKVISARVSTKFIWTFLISLHFLGVPRLHFELVDRVKYRTSGGSTITAR